MSSANPQPPEAKRFETVRVLYDGECPFCAAYVKMARLKALSGAVELVDAREAPDLVAAHAAEGRDVDQGMIVEVDGAVYFGGEAMWAINAMLSPSPLMRLVSSRPVLVFLYPALRACRNAAVRALGKRPIRAGA